MAKKSFLLVSLKENKAKKLAEVISNKTCRKMLDFLAEKKDATESEIAKSLNIPISTVHYNMKALLTARLVKCDEYHYSAKGKEVNHYRLANQYVIIAPEGEKAMIREKLKSIIPTALIMGFVAGVIKLFSGVFSIGSADMDGSSFAMKAAAPAMDSAARGVAYEAAEEAAVQTGGWVADEAMAEAAPKVMETVATNAEPLVRNASDVVVQRAPEAVPAVQHFAERAPDVASQAPEIALWFFIGAVAGVAVYLLVEYIVKRIRDR